MGQRFADQVVLITGATSGVGEAVARRVAAEGAAVVLGARGKEAGGRVAEQIRADGGRAVFVPTDVRNEEEVAALTRVAVDEFGRLDAAFNNVGAVTAYGPVAEIDDAAWRNELELNLTSVFYGLRHQVPALAASGGGAILNNASNLGVVGMASVAPYVAAKHGVVGLSRAVALEAADQGVRVNALVSGAVDTPAFRNSMGATPEGEAAIAALHPLGRISRPEEIASLCAYLLSPESSFVTGAALTIDGGFTAK
ncbi:glucose 1-dehydrogenase [Nocardia cyriacigeorgica]|jgi:NAD(P)-dependent dehydrogenase (short-subunit alcohol dehydrogenase family)|uniref:SDR family NAD(P)-dependent oxidoreductase n=1 Tax=Nocardia cyriacigeorgica TaxID=135487 RepID=UPI0002F58267|nr:glucose 1-dehydrogenase [Nocardia cyriacigeorgica]AVH24724.1 3-oxoacyl-ACP reductase [Nocardia cyriacigeorgica]MBF6089345.1 glucose 1-dehydrogenase [Nocardia cyriacigeorgica]MBF6093795.1 glucose 1-dehydrogenase [Nocardia cyriacigeorgica]MBF6325016.1 glucose 1-dehydrogenase [Nocardia cyriacigeorgica]MBF6398205.1 glucose 1-dehydrogenase [Nocardia cyriacigeorgica]